MEREKYFDCLYAAFQDMGFIPIVDSRWRLLFHASFQKADLEPELLCKINKEFGTSFYNVILINCRKNFLLYKQFGASWNRELFHSSLAFTVLGCIVDSIFDSGIDDRRCAAIRVLQPEYCADYFCRFSTPKNDTAIDTLFWTVGEGLYIIKQRNELRYRHIVDMLNKTASAELTVMDPLCSEDIIVSKSKIFTQIAIEILLAEIELTDYDNEIIENIGYCFAIMDDLCDYYEDRIIGQANLLNTIIDNDNISIHIATNRLKQHLDFLRQYAIPALYEFIFCELSEWIMSCPDLRMRVWKENG